MWGSLGLSPIIANSAQYISIPAYCPPAVSCRSGLNKTHERGGHSNKHHNRSCDCTWSARILRKGWSHYTFFRILSQSQRSKPENQRGQQSKPRKSVQSMVKPRKRAVKVFTRSRSCDCRVYERDLPLKTSIIWGQPIMGCPRSGFI